MNAIKERMNEISQAAANPLGDVRVISEEVMEIGKHCRQGDLYIQRVAEPVKGQVVKTRQLADGSTMGSRHTVDESVTVIRPGNFGQVNRSGQEKGNVTGYAITAKDRFTIDHPEHAPMSLPPGHYQVYHQLDPRSMQAVKD